MSPSQASETCASASSATSAKCRVGHYANASGGCQECLPKPYRFRRRRQRLSLKSRSRLRRRRSNLSESRSRRLRRKMFVVRRFGPRPSQRPSRASWQLTNLEHFLSRCEPRRPRPWPMASVDVPRTNNNPSTKIPNKCFDVKRCIKVSSLNYNRPNEGLGPQDENPALLAPLLKPASSCWFS